MKRFYKTVAIQPVGALFAIVLDGRPVKTPQREGLALRTSGLAEAIAAEWARQGDELGEMPLTRLANTAIDRVRADRAPALAQMDGFAGHDLVCYRAASPPALVAREAAAWDLPLLWVRSQYGFEFQTTAATASIPQPGYSFEALRQAMSRHDEFVLTGIAAIAPLLKSLVLTLALADQRLTVQEAHDAAHVDETFQAEKWGRDEEADARRVNLLAELEAAERFLQLARPDAA